MRLISQDGGVDIPYEMSALIIEDFGSKVVIFASSMLFREKTFVLASYDSVEKALKVMEDFKKSYSGFPMIIGDDVLKPENNFEKLKNLNLTNLIEQEKDGKVEYLGSLTFRFPKNDEV